MCCPTMLEIKGVYSQSHSRHAQRQSEKLAHVERSETQYSLNTVITAHVCRQITMRDIHVILVVH